jgi:4-amino-4-deoxy-L-arabinose transferase-like glycosyltransferase
MRTRVDLALVVVLTLATGALWAGITPAFDKTDEPAHFEYVQEVATLGHPPLDLGNNGLASEELGCWLSGLQTQTYRFYPTERPPWNVADVAALDHTCDGYSPKFDGAMYQATQPPAYYVLAAGAYDLASASPLPTRLLFVRMFSVLLAALAVALTYLMVREVIPGSRWAARAAALALALQPIFMFNESGVNSDVLVVTVAAAIAFVTARAWRRGLNTRHALALGALTGLGVLSKLNFLTLMPSIALLAFALWWGSAARSAWRVRLLSAARLALGALLAVGIYGLYVLVNNDVWHRGAAGTGPAVAESVTGVGSIRRLADFIWQFFLPRLPDRPRLFGYYPLWNDVLKAITTRLGWWNDYGFDSWAPVLVVLGVLIATLAAFYVLPRARRRPWPALVALGAAALFLLSLIIADFRVLDAFGDGFEGRYVFPAMPLWGLLVGCAVVALPPRLRPGMTGLLAALFLAHTVIAISSTTSVFYL